MSGVRLWIVILTLVSASAGFAGGLLVYGSLHEPRIPEGPLADYERLMVEEFELSPERQRLFQTVLASYKQRRDAVLDRHEAESMSAMAPELGRIDNQYRDLIRNKVLSPEQRPHYDSLIAGASAPAPR